MIGASLQTHLPRIEVTKPTLALLKKYLTYHPQSGNFTWNARKNDKRFNTRYAGHIAGIKNVRDGRILLTFENGKYSIYASVAAWAMYYGKWPTNEIDHKNCKSNDDRIQNLREATRSQNQMNSGVRSDNTSGHKGVHWRASRNKWSVRLTINQVNINLGCYDSYLVACRVYRKAARAYFGKYARF